MSETDAEFNLIEMTTEIVCAYVRNNSMPASELAQLIHATHHSLSAMVHGPKAELPREAPQPKVSVKKSVTSDYIVCLEDGKRFRSLKRHLHSEHGLTPQSYRAKWGLPSDYPMVAPAYADARSTLAKSLGLGRKSAPPPPAEPVAPPPPPPPPPAAKAPAKSRRRAATVAA